MPLLFFISNCTSNPSQFSPSTTKAVSHPFAANSSPQKAFFISQSTSTGLLTPPAAEQIRSSAQ